MDKHLNNLVVTSTTITTGPPPPHLPNPTIAGNRLVGGATGGKWANVTMIRDSDGIQMGSSGPWRVVVPALLTAFRLLSKHCALVIPSFTAKEQWIHSRACSTACSTAQSWGWCTPMQSAASSGRPSGDWEVLSLKHNDNGRKRRKCTRSCPSWLDCGFGQMAVAPPPPPPPPPPLAASRYPLVARGRIVGRRT